MNATRTTPLGTLVSVSILLVRVGATLAARVWAKVVRTSVAISTRVSGQQQMCTLAGGSSSTTTNSATGSVSTSCKGGTEDGLHCINTTKITDCHYDRVSSSSGEANPGIGTVRG